MGEKVDCSHHWVTPELIWPEQVLLTQVINKNKLDCTNHCYTPDIIWPEFILFT